MGAFFDPRADTRRQTYNDPASGPVRYDEDVPGWFIYCDNCGSFAVRPSGYQEVYHDYQDKVSPSFSEKLKNAFWGGNYAYRAYMNRPWETRYAYFCYRGFQCADCGTQFIIQREQVVEDPVWTDEKKRLRDKLGEYRGRYSVAKEKYDEEYLRKNPGRWHVEHTHSVDHDLEFREKTGTIRARHYGKWELVTDPQTARKHRW